MRINSVSSNAACNSDRKPIACDLCDVRQRSICADLTPQELAQVDKIMARRAIAKNRAIMREGEACPSLFVIIAGSFRMSKYLDDGRRQVTGFLFPGDMVGVQATDESAYSVEALEDSRVCHFPHKFLDEIAVRQPGLKDRLIAQSQTENHKALDHVVLLGKKSADERVAAFISTMSERLGETRRDGMRQVHLAMSRQDIADYLGLRLETLSRTLAGLHKSGAIAELGRHDIFLPA